MISLSASHFLDNRERIFVRYKGWLIVNSDGTYTKDSNTIEDEGPLKQVCVMISHGNFHSLCNIENKAGEKILSKGVRSIEYNRQGYYVIEDNNEDELFNQYGCIPVKDYVEKWNVVNSHGKLLSKVWFDRVFPLTNNFIRIIRDGKENLIDLNGHFLLNFDVDYISDYNGEYVFFILKGILFKVLTNGKKEKIKCLKSFPDVGVFYVSGCGYVNSREIPRLVSCLQRGNTFVRAEDGTCNCVDRNAYLIFDQWYDKVLYFYGTSGVYFVRKDNKWKLIGLDEIPLTHISFSHVLNCRFGYASVVFNESCSIIDHLGNVVANGYTSFLWADIGVWGVNYYKDNKVYHFYCGQGGEFIEYVQAVMVARKLIGLFEKENVWYYMDNECQMNALIRYEFYFEENCPLRCSH